MSTFLYNSALYLFALISLPKCFARALRSKKPSLRQRLGQGFPCIAKGSKKLIWIHAVSLGETKAVLPLIEKFKSLREPPLILLTTSTETGFEEGKKSVADFHAFLPFDFSHCIRPLVQNVAPDLVILTETDMWFHFQDAARQRGAQVVVINGKLSKRSWKRFQIFPGFARLLVHTIDHWYLQSPDYEKRLMDLGVSQKKLTVTGNIKLDAQEIHTDLSLWKEKMGVDRQPVITLGSTHDPEERIWIEALKKIWKQHTDLKVFIVPRHPERFDVVARLLEQAHVDFTRWSLQGNFLKHNVILVDAMGSLQLCYQLSTLAFVGGSFTPSIGGHNILEPSVSGKPVIYGPYMYSQPHLHTLVQHYQAGKQISKKEIVATVDDLLNNLEKTSQMGIQGKKLIEESKGALEKTFVLTRALLKM